MFIDGADEEGVIRGKYSPLSTSGGRMTCQDFIMCEECFYQGRGGGEILNRMSFQGGKSKPLIDKRCCV